MQLATVLPGEMVQLYYDIVVKSRGNIALANTPLQALEMCLLRLLAFKPLGNYKVPVQTPQPVSELPQAPLPANTWVLHNKLPPNDKVIIPHFRGYCKSLHLNHYCAND